MFVYCFLAFVIISSAACTYLSCPRAEWLLLDSSLMLHGSWCFAHSYKYWDCFCPISLQDGEVELPLGCQTCNQCLRCARHSTSWLVEAQEVSDMRPKPFGDPGHWCDKALMFLHVVHSLSEEHPDGEGWWCLKGKRVHSLGASEINTARKQMPNISQHLV